MKTNILAFNLLHSHRKITMMVCHNQRWANPNPDFTNFPNSTGFGSWNISVKNPKLSVKIKNRQGPAMSFHESCVTVLNQDIIILFWECICVLQKDTSEFLWISSILIMSGRVINYTLFQKETQYVHFPWCPWVTACAWSGVQFTCKLLYHIRKFAFATLLHPWVCNRGSLSLK